MLLRFVSLSISPSIAGDQNVLLPASHASPDWTGSVWPAGGAEYQQGALAPHTSHRLPPSAWSRGRKSSYKTRQMCFGRQLSFSFFFFFCCFSGFVTLCFALASDRHRDALMYGFCPIQSPSLPLPFFPCKDLKDLNWKCWKWCGLSYEVLPRCCVMLYYVEDTYSQLGH